MKKRIVNLCLLVVVTIASTTLISCGNSDQSNTEIQEHEHHAAVYSCPMKCEGDKTYKEADKCPSCGMDLEAVSESHEHESEEHDHEHERDDHDQDAVDDEENKEEEHHHDEHGHDH